MNVALRGLVADGEAADEEMQSLRAAHGRAMDEADAALQRERDTRRQEVSALTTERDALTAEVADLRSKRAFGGQGRGRCSPKRTVQECGGGAVREADTPRTNCLHL